MSLLVFSVTTQQFYLFFLPSILLPSVSERLSVLFKSAFCVDTQKRRLLETMIQLHMFTSRLELICHDGSFPDLLHHMTLFQKQREKKALASTSHGERSMDNKL